MNLIAPLGPVYQAGTLAGNPLAVTAGLATLKQLSLPGTYQTLEENAKYLAEGFAEVLAKHHTKGIVNRVGSMMTLFFGVERVSNADQARQCDRKKFARFFHGMLERGVYLPPAPFEALMISLSHSKADLRKTVAAFDSWSGSDRRS
jgi:glutamate-1-semialdehyde 2,1-aminomutase